METISSIEEWCLYSGADLGGGCGGCAPLPEIDELPLSNTTGILQKKCDLLVLVTPFLSGAPPPPLRKMLDPTLVLFG